MTTMLIVVLLAIAVILAGAAHFVLPAWVRLMLAIGAVVLGGVVLIGVLVHA